MVKLSGPFSLVGCRSQQNDGIIAAISLAPMSVLPEYQRQGIGSKLVNAGLVECRIKGHQIVTVLGHSDFYPQFGFSSRLAQTLESPFGGGADWMALELVPGGLQNIAGRVEFAPAFRKL